jgi:hypothetical protein
MKNLKLTLLTLMLPLVAFAEISIKTTELLYGRVGTDYNQTLIVQNESEEDVDATCTVTNGTLPDGLGFGNDCIITGSPNASVGIYNFKVVATDEYNISSSEVSLSIEIKAKLGFTTAYNLPYGRAETFYETTLQATGDGVKWSIPSGSAFKGILDIDVNTGEFSGTLPVYGSYDKNRMVGTIKVTDAGGNYSAEKEYAIDILQKEISITQTIIDAEKGMRLEKGITTADNNHATNPNSLDIRWSIEYYNLPAGLSIQPNSDAIRGYIISGTPTAVPPSDYTFTVTVENKTSGVESNKTQEITLKIADEQNAPAWDSDNIPGPGTIEISQNSAISGYFVKVNRFATWSFEAGANGLPPGLTPPAAGNFTDQFTFSGIANTVGTYPIVIKATNSKGTYSKSVTIIVNAATIPPTISPPSPCAPKSSGMDYCVLADGTAGQPYSQQLSATSQNGVDWSVRSNIGQGLPPGLSLNSTGLISGTISSSASTETYYYFVVRATDKNNSSNYKDEDFGIYIMPPITVPGNPVAIGRVGTVVPNNNWQFSFSQWGKWSVISGSLPPGLDFESKDETRSNRIIGTPTVAGNFKFTIQVETRDGNNYEYKATRPFNIGVAPAVQQATWATKSDRMLWAPDVSKFPGLQVQTPEALTCNGSADCNSSGYWYGFKDRPEAHNTQVKIDGQFVDFVDGVSLAENGVSKIPSTGMELRMQIDATAADTYPLTGIKFDLRTDRKATNIQSGNGYCLEYSSDSEIILELGWPQNLTDPDAYPYGYNTYYYRLPATNGESRLANISWYDFENEDWYDNNKSQISRSVAYNEATQLSIVFKNGVYEHANPAKTVNFTLKQLGWYNACKVKPTIITTSEDLQQGITGKYDEWRFQADQYAYWSVVGALPEGLSLESYGGYSNYIVGKPTVQGDNTFTLKVTHPEDNTLFTTETFTIFAAKPAAPNITSDPNPPKNGWMGEEYKIELSANTIYAEWDYSGLPDGVDFYDLDEYGVPGAAAIYGYPTKPGSFQIAVSATNVSGFSPKIYNITINGERYKPEIDDYYIANVNEGDNFYGNLNSDRAAYWSIEGNIPPGLELYYDDNTGRGEYDGGYTASIGVRGIATTPDEYDFTVKAWNSVGDADPIDFYVTVYPASSRPQIYYAWIDSPVTTGDNFYGWTYSNRGATWSLGGDIPPGLELYYDDGSGRKYDGGYATDIRFGGIATTAGNYSFSVIATNSAGSYTYPNRLNVRIDSPPTPQFTTTGPFNAIVDELGSWTISANGYVTWSVVSKPSWLNINGYWGSSISVYGTPTTTGPQTFTLKIENDYGISNTQIFTINVVTPPSPEITTESEDLEQGIVDGYSEWAIFANQTVRWSKGSDWPDWLELEDWRIYSYTYIYGIPPEAKDYSFTIKIMNPNTGAVATKTLTISVRMPNPPIIQTTSLRSGEKGVWYSANLEASDYAEWDWSGDVPSGLYIYGYEGDGYIYGTPTEARTYNFTVTATNKAGSNTKPLSITITPEQTAPEIYPADAPNTIQLGQSTVIYLNSNRSGKWSLSGDVEQLGVELNNYDYLDYNNVYIAPKMEGTFEFIVTVTNDKGSNSMSFEINVTKPPVPQISSPSYWPSQTVTVGDYAEISLETDRTVTSWDWTGSPNSPVPGFSIDRTPYYIDFSGRPTMPGTYTFDVTAINAGGTSAPQTVTFTVLPPPVPPPPTITIDGPTKIAKGESNSWSLSSTQNAIWSAEGLPWWLELISNDEQNSYAALYGTPTESGTFTFTITASNSQGSDSKTFTINVITPEIPIITTESLPNGVNGEYYSFQLEGEGGTPRYINWDGELSPPGLVINDTGRISGTPTKAGTYVFAITVGNSTGESKKSLAITIELERSKPQITSNSSVLDLVVGEKTGRYISSNIPANWSVEGYVGSLGLELYYKESSKDVYVYFAPTESGTFTFTLTARNSQGSDSKTFTVNVGAAPAPAIPEIVISGTVDDGKVDEWYGLILTSTEKAKLSWIGGSLPPGLNFDFSDNWGNGYGYIYGTPEATGTFTFLVEASNISGSSNKWFTINISLPPSGTPAIATTGLNVGKVDEEYNDWLYLSSSGNVSWNWIGGDLPPGLNLEKYGYIHGIPTTRGTFTFLVEATNINGGSTRWVTINVIEQTEDSQLTNIAGTNTESAVTIDFPTCMASGNIWENGTCRVKTSKEVCEETAGYIWLDGSCRMAEEIACMAKGEVFVGQGLPCRARTSMESCLADGNIWEIGTGTCRGRTPEEACLASGKVWESGACRAKTLKEVCDETGRYWIEETGVCKTRSTNLSQLTSASSILLNTTSNSILLSNLPNSTKVEVYNLQGKHIYTSNSANAQTMKIPVQTGMYIIKAGNQKMKAVVK